MDTEQELVAVIPARAGSKRLPDKNRLTVGGKSLLTRTVTAARNTPQISTIFLSSNDPDLIADAAQFSEIKIRRRPANLATDSAPSEDVLRDLIEAEGLQKTRIVLLQLTSPFRTEGDITALLAQMRRRGASSGVSVCHYRTPASPPFGATDNSVCLGPLRASAADTRPKGCVTGRWALNGAIYIFSSQEFLQTNRLYCDDSAIHVMENWRSIDIDYPDDYVLAEAIAQTQAI